MSCRLLCCAGSLEGGGSERQLWQLATRISRSHFETSVYLLRREGVYLDRLPADVPVWDFWSQNKRLSPSGGGIPGQIHRAQVAHLTSLLSSNHVEVVYDRTFHMTLITAAACRRANVARVSTIVSPPSRDLPQSGERFTFLKRWLLARAYRDANCQVVAVSEDVAADAVAYYRLRSDRVRVLPSPIDVEGIEAASLQEPAWAEATSPNNKHVVVVGRMSQEKGQSTAVAAIRKLVADPSYGGSIQLHLIGDGPDRAKLERDVSQQGLSDQIHFHGFQENPYPFIRAADLLVVPSQYEGLPNVVLEAMALRTPVLATRCSRSLESVLGGKPDVDARPSLGRLVDVGDANQMAEAVRELLFTPEEEHPLLEQIKQAREYVERHHSLVTWLEDMQRLLLDCRDSHAKKHRKQKGS